jgi:tyrosinase
MSAKFSSLQVSLSGMLLAALPGAALAQTVLPQVEVEFNNTSSVDDDFLCWSPVVARARLLNGQEFPSGSPKVNISGRHIGDDATGSLLFQSHEQADDAPADAKEHIELSLPGDGAWVTFSVMGKTASTSDKDVAILVTDEHGQDVSFLPVMVRVRKDARELSEEERAKFVQAVRDLHNARGFEKYWQAHQSAFGFDIHGLNSPPYPPLFLAWHRAFLLNFERELQQFDRTVALPYWKFDEASYLPGQTPADSIFSPEFLGEHSNTTIVVFEEDHPWFNWRTAISKRPLQRNRSPDPATGSGPVAGSELNSILDGFDNHQDAGGELEVDYHNGVHRRVLGWLVQPYSPADPLFFLLHANVDRGWAHWQARHKAFDTTGTDAKSYHATGSHPGGDAPYMKGSYANDAMWPWIAASNGWPSGIYFQMPDGTHGPDKINPPTPASQIDYLDLNSNGLASHACYDDISYQSSQP